MRPNDWRAKRYRERAEELREVAETTRDPEARSILTALAEDYLRMAEAIETRDRTRPSFYEQARAS
jgi:hypothetical protein